MQYANTQNKRAAEATLLKTRLLGLGLRCGSVLVVGLRGRGGRSLAFGGSGIATLHRSGGIGRTTLYGRGRSLGRSGTFGGGGAVSRRGYNLGLIIGGLGSLVWIHDYLLS
jgi:hypothetical protein